MKKTLIAITDFLKKNSDLVDGFALIGGLAIGGWAIPRATKDIDLFVSLKKTDLGVIKKLVKRLEKNGFEGELYKGDLRESLQYCIKTICKKTNIPVDIIILTKKWEAEIVVAAKKIKIFNDLTMPVAPIEGLIVLKLKAGSIQDIADISKLLIIEDKLDSKKLIKLAKRARVDKNLIRLADKLGIKL